MKRLQFALSTLLAWFVCTLGVTASAELGDTPELDALLVAQAAVDGAARASQAKVEKLDDQTQDVTQRYRRALDSAKSIRAYNEHLRAQVVSQREELASIDDQLASIDSTSRDVFPLMQRMVATLEDFVSLDLPFLQEERKKRVTGLVNMLDRADVSVSEKYRRILEAYQIEMESGRTLEAYDGRIGEGEAAKAVSFLRMGRIALAYQTTDGSETGYWDRNERRWVIDQDYAHDVTEGLRVARKMTAPDLLLLPLPAPVEVQ